MTHDDPDLDIMEIFDVPRITYSVGLDLACMVCAALAVALGALLYAVVRGWISL